MNIRAQGRRIHACLRVVDLPTIVYVLTRERESAASFRSPFMSRWGIQPCGSVFIKRRYNSIVLHMQCKEESKRSHQVHACKSMKKITARLSARGRPHSPHEHITKMLKLILERLVLHAQFDELLGSIGSWHFGRVGIPVQHRLDLTPLRNCLAERIEVCRIPRLEQRAGDVVI